MFVASSVSTRVQGMKRFLLVIALALGLLAASALPAIADEHVAKRSNWSHDRTKVYTTTAVNQHNQYGDLQGILKFRQALCPEHRQLRHSDRLHPTVSGAA